MSLKAPLAVVVLLVGALLGIPVVIGGNGSGVTASCGDLAAILDTIRTIESDDNYATPKNQSGASGAYQYIDSTWNNYDDYASAYLAPPEVQDARAASDVQAILANYGDVAYIPILWYWPRAATDPKQLDIIPLPHAGNRLTVREYQQHWLATYETKSANAAVDCGGSTQTEDGYALPIDRTLIAAEPAMLDTPHHDYPAIDLLIPEGSPVYAARGGTIARIVKWPHNCEELGECEQTCGVGLSIDGDDGVRYIYCHGSQLNGVDPDDTVIAGQLVMWSGNTGRSGAPHLHFEIRVDGEQRCPQRLLRSIFNTEQAIPPADLEARGCSF